MLVLLKSKYVFSCIKGFTFPDYIPLKFLGAVQRNGRTDSTLSLRGKRDKMLEDS